MIDEFEIKSYHIFPPINIARVGNSETSYIIGPERPGCGPVQFEDDRERKDETFAVSFKDEHGLVKRQAARFRVFELTQTYRETGTHNKVISVGERWQEITAREGKDEPKIEWTVTLANRKGVGWVHGDVFRPDWYTQRNQRGDYAENGHGPITDEDLIISPPSMTIEGTKKNVRPNQKDWGTFKGQRVFLGELKTDARGHLLVLGGNGVSGFVDNEAGTLTRWRDDCHYNNEAWYDDTSDGIVTALVTIDGATHRTKGEARVIVGPPDYAPGPGCPGIITQYDQLLQIAKDGFDEERWGWREHDEVAASLKKPSFTEHLYPIIRGAKNLYWTIHTIHKGLCESISTDWPTLSDDTIRSAGARATVVAQIFALEKHLNYLVLTDIQRTRLKRYESGDFTNDWARKAGTEHDLLLARQRAPIHPDDSRPPRGLVRAALEQAMGGGFHPGWEGGKDITNIDNFAGPFRLKGPPGHFVENMAVPWQADLWGCRTWHEEEENEPWWPSHRPDTVLVDRAEAKGQTRRFVDFAREPGGDDIIGRRQLIEKFQVLGFVLPDFDDVWKIDGELVERERES